MSVAAPESVALFYTEGSSDKEYRVELRDEGNGTWMVLGFNGRRGSTLKEQKKTQVPVDYATAALRYSSRDWMVDRESGAVVEGDPNAVTETTELWTFVRHPNEGWKLSAIQDA